MVSEFSYALFNMCGFVNCLRRYLEGKPMRAAEEVKAQKQDEKVEKVSMEKKKAALDFLDEEIQSLNKTTGKKDSLKEF